MDSKEVSRAGGVLAIIGFSIILLVGLIYFIDTITLYESDYDWEDLEAYSKRVVIETCFGYFGIFMGFLGMAIIVHGFYVKNKHKHPRRASKFQRSKTVILIGAIILLVSTTATNLITYFLMEDYMEIDRDAGVWIMISLELTKHLGFALTFLGIGFFAYPIIKKDYAHNYDRDIKPFIVEPVEIGPEEIHEVEQRETDKVVFTPKQEEIEIQCPSCDMDFTLNVVGDSPGIIECPHCHFEGEFE